MSEVQAVPETMELATLMHLENIALARRTGLAFDAHANWSQLPEIYRAQLLAFAEVGRQWAALDHFPVAALDLPRPVPSFRDRLQKRVETALLDHSVWFLALTAFLLGAQL